MTEFSTKIAYSDTCRIKEKWTDDKGIVWYKVIREMQRVSWEAIHHLLVKISDAGVIMESSFKTSGEFPTIVDPKDLRVSNYTIYYLQ